LFKGFAVLAAFRFPNLTVVNVVTQHSIDPLVDAVERDLAPRAGGFGYCRIEIS
jgi:hypothetical protein